MKSLTKIIKKKLKNIDVFINNNYLLGNKSKKRSASQP